MRSKIRLPLYQGRQEIVKHVEIRSRIEKINYRQKEKQVLDSILGTGYDKRIRPSGKNDTDGPATINVNIYLRTISRIDDVKMEYSVQVTFREQWNDERLRYYDDTHGHLKYLTLTDPTKVWMPDTFFRNEKEARKHEIIVPNVYVRIFPNGEILYSIRISLTLACPMDLRLYPLDKQVCVLQIASYGWAKDDLIYLWKEKDPVQVVPGLHLPRFTLEQYKSAYCDVTTNTGEYSCLKVELIFKREFSYYLITIYVPCCMLVIVSWVSFWLDQNAIPARVSLGVTTLLTMSTQTSGINAQLPPVSYTKAIDVWTGVCQGFVFCALLEFALVNYASRSDMQRDRNRERMERARRQWELENADTIENENTNLDSSGTIHGNNTSQEMNHVGHNDGSFTLKKRNSEYRNNIRVDPLGDLVYKSTTSYPHQYNSMYPHHNILSGGPPNSYNSATPCEIHIPVEHLQAYANSRNGEIDEKNCNWYCCKTRGLLAKFPSRAKRIDVISRFIFPLIFAIFNLAYWLYYLFAKSKSPQLES
nr:LOW QUALITY PROTEIN: glutamate-gated chloride channel-like [Lepeophtheirus salmonis]